MKGETSNERRGLRAFWKRDINISVSKSATMDHSEHAPGSKYGNGDDTDLSGSDSDGGQESGSSDFGIECEGGTMVFVAAAQSATVLQHSRHFRVILAEESSRVIRKSSWSLSTTRRIIELLATGSTWIEQNPKMFNELQDAANEVGLDLRIASLINYCDTLRRKDTDRFFDMVNFERYQFRLRARVRSSDWIKLMENDILLLPKTKVLMTRAVNRKAKSAVGDGSDRTARPTQGRLTMCDNLCSDFCVYANGKLDILWTILTILGSSMAQAAPALGPNIGGGESFRLVYYSREGSMPQDLLDQMWRLTVASYTEANVEDRKYLGSLPTSADEDEDEKDANEVKTDGDDELGFLGGVHCRTISSTSILVLRHLFDGINQGCEKDRELPACLIVTSPTPDTLGRLINASGAAINKGAEGNTKQPAEVGMHLERRVHYVSQSSGQIRTVLGTFADYESSAVVSEEFKIVEFEE